MAEQRQRILTAALLTALVITCMLVVASCGLGGGGQPRLILPGSDGAFGMGMSDTSRHAYTFTAIPVCLDKPGRVRIVGAEVGDPHGLVVQEVAVAPWQRQFPGASEATLREVGYPAGPQIVDTVCHKDGRGQWELGLQFARRSADTAHGDAVIVQYEVDGQLQTLRIPFSVTLCTTGDTTTPGCR